MFKIRMLFVFFSISVLLTATLKGQGIKASLQKTYQDEDSLVVTLTIKNETLNPIYLVSGVDDLNFDDYIPLRVNYGSFEAELEARKLSQPIVRDGNVKDTIRIVLPITKERVQTDYDGKTIDIFRALSNLREIYYNRKMSFEVPIPPNDSVLTEQRFLDIDLYNFIREKNVAIDDVDCFFCEQTIILEPNEIKSFSIDLGYLLLRNATYQIRFDYKTENDHFKKETSFLKCLGFRQFKGRITSNVLSIVSE